MAYSNQEISKSMWT